MKLIVDRDVVLSNSRDDVRIEPNMYNATSIVVYVPDDTELIKQARLPAVFAPMIFNTEGQIISGGEITTATTKEVCFLYSEIEAALTSAERAKYVRINKTENAVVTVDALLFRVAASDKSAYEETITFLAPLATTRWTLNDDTRVTVTREQLEQVLAAGILLHLSAWATYHTEVEA